MKNKRNQKNIIWKILLIVFSIVLIICLIIIGIQKYQQKKQQEYYEALLENAGSQPQATEEVPEPETEEAPDVLKSLGIEIPEKDIDFTALKEENSDVYAWIYVPGTNVDYPVLQDFSDPNTVLYGHNMKNGSMFASLHNFEDQQVFEENPYFYIYTEDKTYVYEIFAAYKYNAIHLIYNFDLDNPEIFQNYLDQIFEVRDMSANIRQDVTVNADNRIVTLSTCVSGEKNMRYLVQGVLLNE